MMFGRWWDTRTRTKPAFRMLSSPNILVGMTSRVTAKDLCRRRGFLSAHGARGPSDVVETEQARGSEAPVLRLVQARGLQGFKGRYHYRGASHQVDVALVRPGNGIGPRGFGNLSRGSRIATGGRFVQQLHGMSILLCEINQWCDPCRLSARSGDLGSKRVPKPEQDMHAHLASVERCRLSNNLMVLR